MEYNSKIMEYNSKGNPILSMKQKIAALECCANIGSLEDAAGNAADLFSYFMKKLNLDPREEFPRYEQSDTIKDN